MVALVPEAQLEPFLERLQQEYYTPARTSALSMCITGKQHQQHEVLGTFCFPSQAGPGAQLLGLTEGVKAPWEV
jgi:hypothetical protein